MWGVTFMSARGPPGDSLGEADRWPWSSLIGPPNSPGQDGGGAAVDTEFSFLVPLALGAA